MEFNLKTRNATSLHLHGVLSDIESIIQMEATLGVECTTPQKSQSVPFDVRKCIIFYNCYTPCNVFVLSCVEFVLHVGKWE